VVTFGNIVIVGIHTLFVVTLVAVTLIYLGSRAASFVDGCPHLSEVQS
jgi:hypothetical protein